MVLIQQEVISEEARKAIASFCEKFINVKKIKQGASLDDAVAETLADRDIALLCFLMETGKGLPVSETAYWDDIAVNIEWGLTLIPNINKAGIYLLEYIPQSMATSGPKDFWIKSCMHLPQDAERKGARLPSVEKYIENLNNSLSRLNEKDFFPVILPNHPEYKEKCMVKIHRRFA